uniref:Uncharacterized protein n=1 Tax=Oryza brachyantha TaxID=4533 RepID=J3MIU5_ORYBR
MPTICTVASHALLYGSTPMCWMPDVDMTKGQMSPRADSSTPILSQFLRHPEFSCDLLYVLRIRRLARIVIASIFCNTGAITFMLAIYVRKITSAPSKILATVKGDDVAYIHQGHLAKYHLSSGTSSSTIDNCSMYVLADIVAPYIISSAAASE